MKKTSGLFLAFAFFIFIFLLNSFSSIIGFITDYKWFDELGYTKTFLTKLVTLFKVGVPVFIVLFIILFLYLLTLKKKYYKLARVLVEKKKDKWLNFALVVSSFILSIFVASSFANKLWFSVLRFMNSTKFEVADPIFDNDISFYIFKLPLLSEIIGIVFSLIFLLIIVTVLFYIVMFAIRRPEFEGLFEYDELAKRRNINVNNLLNKNVLKTFVTQIGVFGFIIFIVIALSYLLRSYDLLYSTRGKVFGASYTDINVTLLFYRIGIVTSIISAFTVLIGAIKRKVKIALVGPSILIVVSIIGGIVSGIVQSAVVVPNEISKEKEYFQYNIDYTQRAYQLDNVEEKQFGVAQDLTKEDLINNKDTVENIRINDYRPINQVYNQLQGIRLYYQFNDIDIDRYVIDGDYKQVFLSARELNQEKLNADAQTWINQHLKYTHGYGLALSPVNSVTTEGQPKLLIKNIPPTTETDLKIERPEIYFGELTNNYIIVNTDLKEFNYPSGENNEESIYEGTGGIKLNGLNKLLYAINEGSMKILLSGDINSDSKIVLNRNIKERVKKIAPFLTYDTDPYLVISQEDGKLYWIIDGYTVSDRYPYSQPYKDTRINYIRNSVKVVIDAYNGNTDFYVFDETDPLVKTYKNIFPDLFKSKDEMPEAIRVHTRYPQLMFDIQAEVYKLYHIKNPEVFYNKEDLWDIASEKYMENEQEIESNYLMFKLPDEEKEEFLLTVPYTPSKKQNMTALFVARNDGEDYGKMFIYKFPKNKTIEGPMQIESKIDQDSEISPQLTLWGQEGSSVLRGNLLIIPIEESLLYVEPIYIMADNENSIPEVKRVIVSYKGKIVMEKTLEDALEQIFGEILDEKEDEIDEIDDKVDIEDENVKSLIKNANELFIKSKEALKAGDWTKYGEYLNQLEEILNKLNGSIDGEPETETEGNE